MNVKFGMEIDHEHAYMFHVKYCLLASSYKHGDAGVMSDKLNLVEMLFTWNE